MFMQILILSNAVSPTDNTQGSYQLSEVTWG